MKLLFDENLSTVLPRVLAPHFPGSQHVDALGLAGQPDEVIWDFAKAKGNARTRPIADLFRANRERIARFIADDEESFLLFSTTVAD